VELSRVAQQVSPLPLTSLFQVYMSSRHGTWVVPRLGDQGLPFDHHIIRRSTHDYEKLLPKSYCGRRGEGQSNQRFDHGLYGIAPPAGCY
jgi:Flavin-binding monooxygenase-like.